jgi:chromosome partitioning protein
MTRTVAVANEKGGVAKTTTVASLGVALAELDRRVLLVDLDPEACLTFSLGLDPDEIEPSVRDLLLGRISAGLAVQKSPEGPDLLPATIDLVGSEVTLSAAPGGVFGLRSALERVGFGYQWVLLDCPPGLGALTVAGLTAADEVLIPLQCEALSYRGVGSC